MDSVGLHLVDGGEVIAATTGFLVLNCSSVDVRPLHLKSSGRQVHPRGWEAVRFHLPFQRHTCFRQNDTKTVGAEMGTSSRSRNGLDRSATSRWLGPESSGAVFYLYSSGTERTLSPS